MNINVPQYSSAGHFQFVMELSELTFDDFTREMAFVGRDEHLGNEATLLASRSTLANVITDIADDRILRKPTCTQRPRAALMRAPSVAIAG